MAYKTIVVKGDGIRKEAFATAAITPGHLVKLQSTGKVAKHATAGGVAQRAFAVEDDLQGNEIGDAYSTDNIVQYNVFAPGDEVLAWLNNGENVVIGDFLESAGNGTLRKYSAASSGVAEYPNSIVGVALEAVDMSGSDGVDPSGRILIEIM